MMHSNLKNVFLNTKNTMETGKNLDHKKNLIVAILVEKNK